MKKCTIHEEKQIELEETVNRGEVFFEKICLDGLK